MLDFKTHQARGAQAWADKGGWNALYEQAYRWAIPYRRSANTIGPNTPINENILDITAPIGVARFAGQLQQDLFTPGQPFWKASPGAIAKRAFRARGEHGDLAIFTRKLEDLSDEIQPHFMTGEWDNAVNEFCIDIAAGTGILLPCPAAKGDHRFVRFGCIPFEEGALVGGAFGDTICLFWKTMLSPQAIKAQWPNGKYPKEFQDALRDNPHKPIVINQDFCQHPDGGWMMIVSLDKSEEPVAYERMRTKPFAAARYFKVPGETYGRGPLLMSLPTIRTLNRVLELMLKSSAIQLLGIWGYRPGGNVNPNSFPLRPGAFWPMGSTGGPIGPDVARLDAGNGGEMQVAKLVMSELRNQIRMGLHDEQIESSGQTPKSAAEILAVRARLKVNYLGAFGRLIHEVVPVIVPRVMEILKDARILTSNIEVDHFLTRVEVISPLAMALKADSLKSVFEYIQACELIEGPGASKRRLNLDELMDQLGIDMGVAARFIKTQAERKTYDEQAAAQAANATLAQAALDDPKGMAEAAQIMEGAQPAADGRPNLRLAA